MNGIKNKGKKMKIRKRKQYEEEIHTEMERATKILLHHISLNYLKFANNVLKINNKYFKEGEQ